MLPETVTILDCDFGDGDLERSVLEPLGYDVVLAQVITEAEALTAGKESVGLLTQYTPVTRTLLEASPTVRAVVRYGVGIDVIDTAAAAELGVRFSGVTDYSTDEVADHAVALLLCGLRSIAFSDRSIKQGRWPAPADLPLMGSLAGRRIGLVGFGRIAQAVAKRLGGFGCTVVAHDPFLADDDVASRGATPVGLPEALAAGIVSLHVPVTPATEGMINREAVAGMRDGTVLVNVSRGALLDEQAVLDGLDSGHLALACLDVFRTENAGTPLALHSRVIATPHTAYFSESSLRELRLRAARRVAELLARGE